MYLPFNISSITASTCGTLSSDKVRSSERENLERTKRSIALWLGLPIPMPIFVYLGPMALSMDRKPLWPLALVFWRRTWTLPSGIWISSWRMTSAEELCGCCCLKWFHTLEMGLPWRFMKVRVDWKNTQLRSRGSEIRAPLSKGDGVNGGTSCLFLRTSLSTQTPTLCLVPEYCDTGLPMAAKRMAGVSSCWTVRNGDRGARNHRRADCRSIWSLEDNFHLHW